MSRIETAVKVILNRCNRYNKRVHIIEEQFVVGDNIALSVPLFAIGRLNNKGNRIINRYYVVSIERVRA